MIYILTHFHLTGNISAIGNISATYLQRQKRSIQLIKEITPKTCCSMCGVITLIVMNSGALTQKHITMHTEQFYSQLFT